MTATRRPFSGTSAARSGAVRCQSGPIKFPRTLEQRYVDHANDPAVLQQLLAANPGILQQYVATLSTSAQEQFVFNASLNQFEFTANLPGNGNEATGGLLSNYNIGNGLFIENITPAELQIVSQAIASGTTDLTGFELNVTMNGGNNTLVGGLLGNFTANGGGSNTFVVEDPSLLGLPSGTTIPAAAAALGATFTGSGSADTFDFVGGSSVNPFGNVTLNEPAGASGDTLDFSNFVGGGVDIDLNKTGVSQVLNSGLSLTLPAGGAVTNVIGSPGADTISGNGPNDVLQGAAVDNPNPNALPAVPPPPPPVQWVVLNFTQYAPTLVDASESFHDGNGYYSAPEQGAVLAGIENIYSQFSSLIKFSLDPAEITQLQGMTQAQLAQIDLTPADVTTLAGLVNPTFQNQVYDGGAGNYETIDFNDTPVFNDGLSSGGVSAAVTANLSGGAVTSLTITSGGAGYDSVPSVTLLSGAGAAAVATVSGGSLTAIAVTSVGVGYTSAPTVAITGGGGSGGTATAVVTGGQVTAINITSAGMGYTSAPTITLISGSGAMATAILGVSAALIANPGSGYTSAPTVTISGGGGTGATASAVITNGQVTAIAITNLGSGYTSPPTITLTGGGYTTVAAATAVCSVIQLVVTAPGSGYTSPPTVMFGTPSPGGFSQMVDFGDLSQTTTVQLDPNGFLGDSQGLVPDSSADSFNTLSDFVNMSITISAHELGHTLGLEHMDSLGPIGFGISNPPGITGYYPNYAGPVGAFTTQGDVIASPASVGSTLADAADGLAQFGARDAITLAFITDGTTVDSDVTDPSNPDWTGMPTPTVAAAPEVTDPLKPDIGGVATVVSAQPVSLYDLSVPNPITTGFDAGKTFDVSAVDIDGYIGDGPAFTEPDPENPGRTLSLTQSVPDYYTFTGQAGQLMSFQAMSASLKLINDPVDTTLTIYDPNGKVVAYNDDQFEPSDSSIFDLTLPLTGTYTVEVAAFHSTDPSFDTPGTQNYLPAAFYNAEHGAFELFMYTFSAYNASVGNDTIRNTTIPNTTIPNTTITTLSSSASQNTVVYGQPVTFTATITGDNSTPPTGEVEFNEGATKLGSGTLANGMDQATYTLTAAQTAALSVGSHSFSATYNGDSADLASSTTEELMLMVTQATPTVTATWAGWTYDGTAHAPTVTVTGVGGVTLSSPLPTFTYYVGTGTGGTNLGSTAPISAGTYTVVASYGSSNYASANSNVVTVTINKATATVVVAPYSVTYNGSPHTATVTSITGVNGETGATVGTVTLNTTNTNAGTYSSDSWSFTGAANYNNIASTTITDTINKAFSTATTVGAGPFTYTGSAQIGGSGTVSGAGGLSTSATSLTYSANANGSGTADETDAGTYYVTAHYAGDANHLASDGTAVAITIGKASSMTTTVGAGPFTYTGSAQVGGSGTVTGANLSTSATSLTYSANANGTGTADETDAGTYYVTAHYAGDANHMSSDGAAVAITIGKATATVVVTPYTVTYDGSSHTATVTSITGVNGETGATVGTVTLNTTHTNAGTYASDSWSFTGAANYNDIASTAITDTIAKAGLTITANSASKTYGQTLAFSPSAFTETGLVTATGDAITGVTETSTGAPVSATVGNYNIVPSAAQGTGLSNYKIKYVNGVLTINQATLTITASDASKTYGAALSLGTTAFTTSGLQNSDAVTRVTLTSPGAAATANVAGSAYAIVPSAAAGSGVNNYAIQYVNGALTVNTASLLITAKAATKTYGQSLTFAGTEFTTSGLARNGNGDAVTSVTLTSDGAVATASVAGLPYSIVPSAAQGSGLFNYTISYVAGALTVNPAVLNIVAGDQSKTYGNALDLGTAAFTTSGLVNGDTVTGVTLTSLGAAATATVAGSSYPIVPSAAVGSGLGNYTIKYASGALKVTKAALTITANSTGKTYGQTVAFAGTEFTTSGLVTGDTVNSVTLTSNGAAATASVAGSPYSIVASAAVGSGLSNYTVSYLKGLLTINQAALTITANDASKTYGAALSLGTTAFTTSGLLNSDTVTRVTLTSPGAAATANVAGSPYAIVPSAAAGSGVNNYTIQYVNGALTVNTASLLITAKDATNTYGQSLTFAGTEFTTSGLARNGNGDAVTSVTLTSDGAVATASVAGSPYSIVPSAAQGSGLFNYTISYADGALTVNPAALKITAGDQSKTYGNALDLGTTAFTTGGLAIGDTVTGVTLTSLGAAATATVAGSSYPHRSQRAGGQRPGELHDQVCERCVKSNQGRTDDHGEQHEQDLRADRDLCRHRIQHERPRHWRHGE